MLSEWVSEVAQSCPTLCNPMDCSPPGSSTHGILQTRILEWVAISFSRGSSQHRDRTQVSFIVGRLFTLWGTRVHIRYFQSSVGGGALGYGRQTPCYIRGNRALLEFGIHGRVEIPGFITLQTLRDDRIIIFPGGLTQSLSPSSSMTSSSTWISTSWSHPVTLFITSCTERDWPAVPPSPTWRPATATWEEPCQQQHLLLPQGLSLCGETAVTHEQGVKTGAPQDPTAGRASRDAVCGKATAAGRAPLPPRELAGRSQWRGTVREPSWGGASHPKSAKDWREERHRQSLRPQGRPFQDDVPVILTNYVIQKQNANFIQVDAAGNKRHGPLSFFSSFSVL